MNDYGLSSKQNNRFWESCKALKTFQLMGWSPGLVVMGEDSCSEDRGFETNHQILDGHFSHLIVVKIVKFF